MNSYSLLLALFRKTNWSAKKLILPLILTLLSSGLEAIAIVLAIPIIQTLLHEPSTSIFNKIEQFTHIQFDSYQLGIIGGLFLVIIILKNAAGIASALYFSRLLANFVALIKNKLFSHLLYQEKIAQKNVGGAIATIITFPDQVYRELLYVQLSIVWIINLFFYIAILLILSWKITLIVCAVLGILQIGIRGILQKMNRISTEATTTTKVVSGQIQTILSGLESVILFQTQADEIKRFNQSTSRIAQNSQFLSFLQATIAPIQDTLIWMLIIGTLLLINHVNISVSITNFSLLAIYIYTLKRASTALQFIGRYRSAFAQIHGPLEAIHETLETPIKKLRLGKSLLPLKEAIRFSDIVFTYTANSAPTLKTISCTIRSNAVTGITGPSGSGKSTLAKLLLDLETPDSGTILFDKTPRNILSTKSIRSQIFYSPHDPLIIPDTIRNNILYGLKITPSSQFIEQAITKAKFDTVLKRFPQGLDTVIGEKQTTLSTGERQRLGLVRLFLHNKPITILDESLNGIDYKTANEILDSIFALPKQKTTVIIISHNPSILARCNNIITLKSGKIVK